MSRTASSLRRAAAVAMLGLVTPIAALAQSSDRSTEAPFRWKGAVAEGAWLRVHNLNGPIRVERATGAEAEIVGTKSWRNGDPADVRFVSKRVGADERDVIVCALWGDNSSCDENGYRSNNNSSGWRRRNNDVKVEFVVRVPKGVRVMVATVNGDVDVTGATAEVKANTVNGAIEATSEGGPVTASTVNGDVRVRMGSLGGTEALSYSTVNGSMTIEMPAGDLDADLEMQTVNGRLSADYPITMQGRISSRHLRGTIGKGGRSLRFHTVNGNVDIRRRGT